MQLSRATSVLPELGLIADGREIWKRRDLLVLLVQKDLKVKYKGTALGFFWSLLNPLLMMLVYTVLFSIIARFAVPNYPVFLLAGLLPWQAFIIAISSSSMSVIGNAGLVRRVRFPLEFLPLTTVLSSLVNLLLSLVILLGFALVFRVPLGPSLITLPLLLLMQAMFMIGACLIISSLTVYFRDLEQIVGILLTALFFVTPVLYPLSAVSGKRFAFVLMLNPLTWLVQSYQDIWHDGTWPHGSYLLAFGLLSVALLLAGRFVFRRLEGRFAEEV